jgi:hypothetical protein
MAPLAEVIEFCRSLLTVYRCNMTLYKLCGETKNDLNLFESLNVDEIKLAMDVNNQYEDPEILMTKLNSPLIIMIIGFSIILHAIAIILNGGIFEFKFGPIKYKIKLKSLGQGIKSLRDAMSNNSNLIPMYNFQNVQIVLNHDEYNELIKPANNNGGFQRYLNELQGG